MYVRYTYININQHEIKTKEYILGIVVVLTNNSRLLVAGCDGSSMIGTLSERPEMKPRR